MQERGISIELPEKEQENLIFRTKRSGDCAIFSGSVEEKSAFSVSP